MYITYRVSRREYLDAMRLFLARRTPRYRALLRTLLPWMGGILILVEIIVAIVVPNRDLVSLIPGSLLGFYFVYCGFALPLHFRRTYERNVMFKHDFSADISEDGIHITTATLATQYKWSNFARFVESDSLFLLYTSGQQNFVALPKRAFAATDISSVRELLQRQIQTTP